MVVEAFGNRHALQNTIDEEIDSFLMKAVCNFTKLGNPVLLPFFYRGYSVLSKALTEQVAKLREMLMKCSIVVPSASLECEKGRRRRLLECFPQLLLGFAGIKGRLPAKPDAPPVGDAEDIQRLNRIWFNFSGQEFSERHIQRACNPQIDRKHRQLLAGSPTRHRCGAHSQHSRKTGKALGICRSPDQTRQLLSTQQCGRSKCSTDHVLDLTGSPYLPVLRFSGKKTIAGTLIDGPFGAEPLLTARAASQRTTLAEQRLRLSAVSADRLKRTAMVRAVLHYLQSPKQRHMYGPPVLAPAVEAPRAPSGHTPREQLRRQNRFPGKHREIREICPPSELADHRREPSCTVTDAVDRGGEAPCLGFGSAGEHITVSGRYHYGTLHKHFPELCNLLCERFRQDRIAAVEKRQQDRIAEFRKIAHRLHQEGIDLFVNRVLKRMSVPKSLNYRLACELLLDVKREILAREPTSA